MPKTTPPPDAMAGAHQKVAAVSDAIDDAEAAAVDAVAKVHAVETALLEPGSTTTVADLIAAENDAEQARKALARASDIGRRVADEAAERVRLVRIEQMRELIRTSFGEHDAGIVSAFDDAVAALAPLVERVAAHNAALSEILAQCRSLGDVPSDIRPSYSSDTLRLERLDVSVDVLVAEQVVAEAAWRALAVAGQPAGALGAIAGIGQDRQASTHLGIPNRPDGSIDFHGPSDRIRRAVRVVTEDREA